MKIEKKSSIKTSSLMKKNFRFLKIAATLLFYSGIFTVLIGLLFLLSGLPLIVDKSAIKRALGYGKLMYSFGTIIGGVFVAASGELMKVFMSMEKNIFQVHCLLEDRKVFKSMEENLQQVRSLLEDRPDRR